MMNGIEDFLCTTQVSKRWICAESYNLVEDSAVLVQSKTEDLGMDLVEVVHRSAVLKERDA